MAKKCPACNADNRDGALVCEYCGTRLSTDKPRSAESNGEKRFCTSCGKPLAPDAAFCPFCGAKRNDAAQTSAPAPEQVPAARQVPIPPRTPASQGAPVYMQPGYQQQVRAQRLAAQNASKTKKSTRGLSVFLVLVFVVELAAAAFKYPGFLNKVKTVTAPDNPYVRVIDTADESGSRALMRSVSPGNPANLTIVPDAKKIAKIHPVTAAVSPEDPVCTAGDITADFGAWNLDAEDTFEVRALGEAEDAANDCRLVMYDFALSSGKEEFATGVTITMPRTAGEYDGKVVRWNEEKGAYEPTAFEVSDDGKWYTVTLYHFSGPTEVISNSTKRVVYDKVSASDVGIFSVAETYAASHNEYYRGAAAKYPVLQTPVVFTEESFDYLIRKMQITELEPKYVSRLKREGRIDKYYYQNVLLSTLGTGIDIGGNITSFVDAGVMGDMFTYAGLGLTSYMVVRDLLDNPDNKKEVIEDHWSDLVGALTTVAGFYPPAAMACTIFGLTYTYLEKGMQYVEDHAPMDYEDAVYRYYLIRHSGGLYSEREFFKLNGMGWDLFIDDTYEKYKKSGNLNDLEKEIESTLDHYIEAFWYGLSEADRRELCRECAGDKTYLIWHEPLSSQFYFDMEAGWKDPPKTYVDEYMKNAKDILCRNLKGTFEKMAKKYLDEVEVELKERIYNEILPELNDFMVFRVKTAGETKFLDSPYADPSEYSYVMWGERKYNFDEVYLYSLSPDLSFDIDRYPMRFWPEIDIRFKPLNMKDYNFKGSFIPHANFFMKDKYSFPLVDGEKLVVLEDFSRPPLERPEDIVFVCKNYFYLMANCPRTIQMLDSTKEDSEWIDCKLERGRVSVVHPEEEKGAGEDPLRNRGVHIHYIDVLFEAKEEEKKPDAKSVTYQMVLQSNSPIEYEEPTDNAKNGDWLTYTKYGADNTVTVTGDKVSISLNEIDYVWKNSSFGEDGESMVFTFKRDAVTLNGTLTEEFEDDDRIIKRYTLKDPPPIKGSYKEEKAWDSDRTYTISDGMKTREYTASEYAEFFSYSLTKEYKQTQSSGGTVTLQFDQSGTKLKRASITLNGSGEFKWWYNDRYARVMAEVLETSGTEQQDISFLIVLRAPK
ncbi:MAG: zinc ribbon domain-containing protein [Clostridia bacterium]|nr:zinc ribbon domain-containing protein [Clostridia bacterium]